MVIIESCCKRNPMSIYKTTSTLDSSSPTDWCYEYENTTNYSYSYVYERPDESVLVSDKIKYSPIKYKIALVNVPKKIIKDFNHRR